MARFIDNSAEYLLLSPEEQAAADLAFVASAELLGFKIRDLAAVKVQHSASLGDLQKRLTEVRVAAMASKDFSAVDALKAALIAAGVEVRMSKAGVELVPGPDFDPAKLEALK